MKSKNNKENHKNCQNQGPRVRFSKLKDLTAKIAILSLILEKQPLETLVNILARSNS